MPTGAGYEWLVQDLRLCRCRLREFRRFRFAGDYEFLLRELRLADALFVPSLTVGAEFGGVTTSPENVPALLRETREALSLHGIRPPWLR